MKYYVLEKLLLIDHYFKAKVYSKDYIFLSCIFGNHNSLRRATYLKMIESKLIGELRNIFLS